MKKFNKNKAFVFLLIVLIALVVISVYKKFKSAPVVTKVPAKQEETKKEEAPAISITIKKISEENFSGTMPVISGSLAVAEKSREFIDQAVAEFKKQADTDVPDMRKKFGADSPPANYTIDIGAKYSKAKQTESIIMTVYTYTGGANGNSSYNVITQSRTSGKILLLSSVVKTDKQAAFTAFVKKQLDSWRPQGSDIVVFPDAVKDLTFDSFSNWSFDDKNLIIYFDKYEIGPGVLGAVAFPLSIEKIKDFLNATYI